MRRYFATRRAAERFVRALESCGSRPSLMIDTPGYSVLDNEIGNDYADIVQRYLDGGGRADRLTNAAVRKSL